ncbi:hypothetical protein A2U01_0097171, partial [Trifolium medium]|nr:hypothetical protein [Trifolium medium]
QEQNRKEEAEQELEVSPPSPQQPSFELSVTTTATSPEYHDFPPSPLNPAALSLG